MNGFKTYHPIVNFIYFVFVIGFSCVFMHPICLAISLICSFTYSVMLKGRKSIKMSLSYMLPMFILMALVNPVFNHGGVTIITYLPSGNPLTMESMIYGVSAATMIVSVIAWFSCYHQVMTSDKFIYLFGKIIPSMSLVISMTFRFVPKFLYQLKTVVNAQRCMGRDVATGSILNRVKQAKNILSIMLTWALENALETAESMKSRGYGLPGRTSFSIFRFDKRDQKVTLLIVVLGLYTLFGNLMGGLSFSYFPAIEAAKGSVFNTSVFVSYLFLCMYPIMIEIWEVRKWKVLESKM